MERSTRSIDIPTVSAAVPHGQPAVKKTIHPHEQKYGSKIPVPVIENETVAMLREAAGF